MTTIGERRPREGRCERCDRPLTDEAFYGIASAFAVFDASGERCRGDFYCSAPIDWRARALAAEAALADAEARGRAHGLLAACMWTLGEKESYENHPHRRAIPTLKWDAFDRGRWLGIVNGLDALERLDPTPRPPSETVFMEASRDE